MTVGVTGLFAAALWTKVVFMLIKRVILVQKFKHCQVS